MRSALAALTWDPQIRGFLITFTAIAILCGSVYLLLATNTGARVGLLLAVAGLSGWMFVLAVLWAVFAQGMKGRQPHWDVLEVVTGDARSAPVEALDDFPAGWRRLRPGVDPVLGDAQAAADKVLAPDTAPLAEGEEREESRFEPPFDELEDYALVGGFDKGGDNELFTIGSHKFFFRHSPHYAVVQVAPVLDVKAEQLGGPPPRPQPDPAATVTSVIMIRDLGSIRFPPVVLALASLTIFVISCVTLHRRDKEIMARRAGGDGSGARLPAPAGTGASGG